MSASANCATTSAPSVRWRPCPGERRAQRGAQGRNDAEDERRHERDHDGEEDDAAVEPDRFDAREGFSRQCQHRLHAPPGEQQAGDGAEERQHEPFGDELSHDAGRAGAERRADRELPLPRSGAREHQVRDVRASDQQHDGDGPHQDENHLPALPDDFIHERPHRQRELRRHTGQHGRIMLRDRLHDGGELGARLLDRHARLQTGDHAVVVHAAEGLSLEWRERDRQVKSGRFGVVFAAARWELEGLAHHADHGVGLPVQRDGAADRRRIASEGARP
jgi:hypothetical protein